MTFAATQAFIQNAALIAAACACAASAAAAAAAG